MKRLISLVLVFSILLASSVFVMAAPNGASVSAGASTRYSGDTAQNDSSAFAGNITELTVSGYSITQAWQGYFGNVTGGITLADNLNNVMYNWSTASPEGEIYASTNNSVVWGYIQCFNLTAMGNYTSDLIYNGSTGLYGTNVTILETEFGIAADDVDGVNETFYYNGTQAQGENLIHNQFYTNSLLFTPGECPSTHLFDDSNSSADNNFQEVILYEPSTSSVVFATLLNENVVGFDNNPHDFEMLVLEDGHENSVTDTYYFWVELE